jgi:hypothetical protein
MKDSLVPVKNSTFVKIKNTIMDLSLQRDSVSYSLGVNIAHSLKSQGFEDKLSMNIFSKYKRESSRKIFSKEKNF